MNPQEAMSRLLATLDSLLHNSVDKMQALTLQVNEAFVGLLTSLANDSSGDPMVNIEPLLSAVKAGAISLGVPTENMNQVLNLVQSLTSALNTPETIAATTVLSYVIVNAILTWGDSPPPGKPYPIGKYDPVGARIYFDRRPLQVAGRALTIATKSMSFALALAQDKLRGDETWTKNQEKRGLELAQLLTELGPTFIKSTYSLTIEGDMHCIVIEGEVSFLLLSSCFSFIYERHSRPIVVDSNGLVVPCLH